MDINLLLLNATAVLITVTVIVIVYFKWSFNYWAKHGVPTLNPTLLFGDAKDLITQKSSFGLQYREYYEQFKARGMKHGGVYLSSLPSYVPVDTDIIKNIMLKDFQYFINRGRYINERTDPLSGHLFNLEDVKWRNMRVKLTPTFTSGKMKMMFQTLADCANELNNIFAHYSSSDATQPMNIKEYMRRYTTDVIGSCAFGIDCNCLKDPDAEFRRFGKRRFEHTKFEALINILPLIIPMKTLKWFNFKQTKADVERFFLKTVRETVEYREQNNIYRKDFMHLLLQLKNRGRVADEGEEDDRKVSGAAATLTMNELSAHAFVFFIAGFETSSTTLAFGFFELASNPDIQERTRNEIMTVLAKYHGQLTYEAAMEMTYLEHVIQETLRKYPPVTLLLRRCTKDYIEPNTSAVIPAGVHVGIPIYGIHYDPEYYPDPNRFDPDRFTDDAKLTRPQFTWLPFGEGPRACIGLRFGMLQIKVAIITMLKQYRVELNEKTQMPLKFNQRDSSSVLATESPIWLNIRAL